MIVKIDDALVDEIFAEIIVHMQKQHKILSKALKEEGLHTGNMNWAEKRSELGEQIKLLRSYVIAYHSYDEAFMKVSEINKFKSYMKFNALKYIGR